MISKYTHKNISWIDVENPSHEEIQHLKEEYELPVLAAEELRVKTLRGKVDYYEKKGLVYMVLHFPTILQHGDEHHNEIEIDFIIGKDFLITAHYEEILSLKNFAQIFNTGAELDKNDFGDHAGFVFFHIARKLYKSSLEQLRAIDEEMELIEDQIFHNKEEKMVRKISELNRKILDFRQAINVHGDILNSFENAAKEMFGDGFRYYLSDILGEYRRVKTTLEGHREVLYDLKDTNDALLTNKTNKVMKALTIVSFIMLPLTLVTGIFGMNTGLILTETDFYKIIFIMGGLGFALFIYFKAKRWF
jgi:magnesium transporter